jgi:hypothetical protein
LLLQKRHGEFSDDGHYACVFFSPAGRATKVFRRRSSLTEEESTFAFRNEVEGYVLAQSDERVRALVPPFHGVVSVERVLDEAGRDISSQFILSCAFQMDRMVGTFTKMGLPDVESNLFQSIGIHGVDDTSVVMDASGKIICVIDFAVARNEVWHKSS